MIRITHYISNYSFYEGYTDDKGHTLPDVSTNVAAFQSSACSSSPPFPPPGELGAVEVEEVATFDDTAPPSSAGFSFLVSFLGSLSITFIKIANSVAKLSVPEEWNVLGAGVCVCGGGQWC